MRHVTTWFGTFLLDDDDEVVRQTLFPKDPHEIAARLKAMDEGSILAEEEELASDNDVLVREKRLELLGDFVPFDEPDIAPERYGYGQELLGQAMVSLGKEKIKTGGTPDEHIVQAIRAIDDLTKTINLMSERLHEWHALNFPELERLTTDSKYAEIIAEHGDRESIVQAGEVEFEGSIGSDISAEDAEAVKGLATTLLSTAKAKEEMEAYVQKRMLEVARNTAQVAGPLIGARLISLAGGLERLSRLPSSTIQLLGAEKAMFKHIKDKAKPPKHGVIFQHPYVHRAPYWQRGKIARTMASKITIAARIDQHGDRFLGEELQKELEARIQDIQRKYPNPPKKGKKR